MIVYAGKRTQEGCTVTRSEEGQGGGEQPLPLRLDLWDHSPTGCEWGYGGSGPAQLALALLADALGDEEKAVVLHQDFKWAVVARLPPLGWQLTEEEIHTLVAAVEKARQEERAG